MSMVTLNGIAVHVETLEGRPGAPTAVLLHGMASDTLASWYFTVAKPLSQAGLRVMMYDLRGHGHSERPPTGYRLDDFVDDLAALVAEVDPFRPVYLLGNSFGGTIAFSYAARHPDRVAGLAALESAPPTETWMKRVALRLAGAADGQLPVPGAVPGRRAGAAREMLSSTTLVRDISASVLPGQDQITRITCPVLCVYGGDSKMAGLAPTVRQLLRQARIEVVPGQKHSILIEAPELIRDLVLSWLDQDCAAGLGQPAA
jgi:pimeloyl-ACP methyl ester carboxylesterase